MMINEINIYTKLKFKKILNDTNLFFNGSSYIINKKHIFAPYSGNYTVSLYKGNIRICYWNEESTEGSQAKSMLQKLVLFLFAEKTIYVDCPAKCDFFDNIQSVKKIHI